MKSILLTLIALLILALPAFGFADSLFGRCIGKGGNKCQTHHRISTSWNGKTGRIDAGRGTYALDFGGKVGKTITVYCDGNQVGKVHVNGQTEFKVSCR